MDYIEEQVTGLWNWRTSGKKGRTRALSYEQVKRARWMYAKTSNSMEKIGQHFHVSQGVIQDVIDKKGAYRCNHPWHATQPSTCPMCHPEHPANN
jgi:hypothetical protein